MHDGYCLFYLLLSLFTSSTNAAAAAGKRGLLLYKHSKLVRGVTGVMAQRFFALPGAASNSTMILAIASAMWAIGIFGEAISFF